MHTNHKTQYKPIKQTTPEHQKQNQTRTTKTDTERENTNGKRKQPKTAQILLFCRYLKKEYQHRRGVKSIGTILSRFKRVLLWARANYQGGAKYLNSGQIKAGAGRVSGRR